MTTEVLKAECVLEVGTEEWKIADYCRGEEGEGTAGDCGFI